MPLARIGLSQWIQPIPVSLQSVVPVVGSRAAIRWLPATNTIPLATIGELPIVPTFQRETSVGWPDASTTT